MEFKELVDKVCGELPEGWAITINLELNSGDVELTDPLGEEIEYSSNRENTEQSLLDALEHARAVDVGED